MNKRILITASLLGAIAVILGAFGAHGLKKAVGAGDLEIWAKGVEYQFYHVFALLFLARFKIGNRLVKLSYGFFTFGILLFSGSLYLLATRSLLNAGFVDYIGPVTPIGGLLLILGWLSMFLAALKE
ncbi:MAG TPA: DUF423 domain-containing protein [Pedobacter sp.]|uniref:DUF423 domain-containing protein n=1 Tax=Pedobacter sp. TaxID=1411316 RepID=UPI002B611427|nr:DUF423 domain-containing protein [Pedobacter sp.]HMI05596.1 DUF423 domain-containing protein [Pedobacter sp.]